GVTNFRLDRTFDGMDLSASAGETADNMGQQYGVSWAFGTKTGERGHIISSIEYQQIDPIDYDPLELGSWFRRYGIVANPASIAPNAATGVAGNLATEPQRLVLPDVHSRQHSPTGRIGAGRTATNGAVAFSLTSPLPPTPNPLNINGNVFTYDGTGIRPYQNGNVIGGATSNQSGGPEADIANQAFQGGPYGAEVVRQNAF